MNLFETKDYRSYIRWRLEKLPAKTRELRAVRQATGINVSVLSQVLNHRRELSAEQAFALGQFLNLSEGELEYFCGLVALSRGENPEYRAHLLSKLSKLREEAHSKVENPRSGGHEAKEEEWARFEEQFFSVWYYSAIYLMTSVASLREPEAISTYLKLPRKVVKEVLERLADVGLCTRDRVGEYRMNPGVSIRASSRGLQDRHRLNWRLRASQALFESKQEDHFFTHAMTVSEADADRIRGWLEEVRVKIDGLVESSKPEIGICLNLDLFAI
jgi:uncharacterized protein (TIGR02147 family)